MSVLPFDLPDKAIQPTSQFIFLTGTGDFIIRKTAVAKTTRARGQRFFVYMCKRHGANEHYLSCMVYVRYQEQWHRDDGKHKPDLDIKPFSPVYTIAAVLFKGIRL